MIFTPFEVYNVCGSIESLRDFIEINRRYFSEVLHDKPSAMECDEALKAMAKYRLSLTPAPEEKPKFQIPPEVL